MVTLRFIKQIVRSCPSACVAIQHGGKGSYHPRLFLVECPPPERPGDGSAMRFSVLLGLLRRPLSLSVECLKAERERVENASVGSALPIRCLDQIFNRMPTDNIKGKKTIFLFPFEGKKEDIPPDIMGSRQGRRVAPG